MTLAEVTAILLTSSLILVLVHHTAVHHAAEDTQPAPVTRPNFIIILADDIGWGDLGSNWERAAPSNTPHLDQLALEGKRFTDFHSPASTCSPSRAALLTGRHGLRSGVTHNFAVRSVGGLPLNETTFAELLQKAGFYTAMIGKWHLGHEHPYQPVNRGFDYYLGIPYSNDMGCTDRPGFDLPSCPPCERVGGRGCGPEAGLPLFENQTIVEQPLDLWDLTDRYASAAVSVLHRARKWKQPFLLYVALAQMHVPLCPGGGAEQRDVYAAALRQMDGLVGAIKSASDLVDKENTLLLFTGDNGPWEKKCLFSGNVGPFLGQWQTSRGGGSAKTTTWEAGHRVPTVAYWPSRIAANSTSDALLRYREFSEERPSAHEPHSSLSCSSSGLDVFPTILSLAGVDPPSDRRYDGIDMTDVLLSKSDEGHKSLLHPNSGAAGAFGDLQAVRLGRYKAFYLTGAAEACGGGRGTSQLHDPPLIFDLSRDPEEACPLDPKGPEYLAVLEAVQREREALLWDIATDNVSTADYKVERDAAPCCNPQLPACRCHRAGWT